LQLSRSTRRKGFDTLAQANIGEEVRLNLAKSGVELQQFCSGARRKRKPPSMNGNSVKRPSFAEIPRYGASIRAPYPCVVPML
jgi:hypothetical protein